MARANNGGRKPASINPLNEDPAAGHGLAHVMFAAGAAGTSAVPLTAGQLTYTQNFDSLASSGATGTSLPADWTFSETGGAAPATYSVGTGSGTTGDTWSFGIAGTNPVTDRAFGSLASTTVTQILIGASFANMSGAAITAILVSYVGEQWRRGGNTVADRLDFQISFNATSLTSGSWTDVNGLDFVSINASASALTLDGNASANRLAISFNITGVSVANGGTFWIRWIDTNIGGNDDGLAIDNFALTATINRPPVVASEIPDYHGNEDSAVSYTIPANSFSDPDGNALTYTARRADDSPLPAWLAFTAATRTFSGTPPANFNGTLSLKVTASDGTFSVSDIFSLIIDPVNDAAIIGGTDTGAVTEDGSLTASGQLTISDVDAGENVFQAVAAGAAGDNGHGNFAMLANGGWTYTLDNGDPEVQALHAVDTLADTLTILAADGTSHLLSVAIHGANEASANPYARVADEALVNSSAAGLQSQPSVAFLADGRYVVVFQVFDGDQLDVRGRIFNRDGSSAAPDFSVNTIVGGEQHLPQVAALAGGGFVVLWQDSAGGSYDIKGRIYQADGSSGGEIPIAATSANETAPAVAGLPGGGFVALWIDDSDPDGDVRGQVFLANGSPAGLSFAVNAPAAGGQVHAAVTVLAGGTIVAVWEDGAAGDVRMRLFSAAGIALTAELTANGSLTGSQGAPCVVALTGGGYAVAWMDGGADGDGYGIYARLFEADGDPAGAGFRVNTLAAGDQMFPAISALPDGGFILSWADGAGPDADDVRAQRFDATGVPVDAELVVNGHAGGVQYQPAMAANPSGTLVVAWNDASSPGVGGDDDGAVLHALLTPGGVAPPAPASPTVDLNGPDSGIDFAAGFTESGASAIGGTIVVTAPNLAIIGATVTIADAVAGDQLILAGALPATIVVLSGAGSAQLVLGGVGTAADWAAALTLVRYTHSGDNPDAFGTDLQRAIGVVVSDGVATSAPAVATVTIAAVNDAPAVAALDGDSVLWSEGDPYVLLDRNGPAMVFDPDNQNFGGGFLSIGVQANPRAEDEFFVLDIDPGVGTIGNQVYVDGAHIGTITSSGPGQILTIGFNAAATAERVATLLGHIAYRNLAGDDPSTGARSVTYLLNDGKGGAAAGVVAVDVAAVDDAPVVTTMAGTTAYAESVNTAPGTIAVDDALTVVDADDIALLGARVSITGNFEIGQDILAFTNDNATAFGNISAFYNAGTGVLTLTSPGASATLAQWQAALRAVTYSNSSDKPGQATRTISFVAYDGEAESAAATRLLSVIAQNDSPSGADGTATIDEDAIFTFTAAHFGFTDVDGDAFAGVRFGAAPAGGTLYFDADGAGGGAPVAVTSFPTAIYSAADIAAGKLSFVPAADLNGTAAASIGFTLVDDGGTAGAGQNADATPNMLTFDIISVNDQPSGADRTIIIDEDAAYTLEVADFGFSDVDGDAFEAVILSNVAGGTLSIDGNPMTNATLVYLHMIESGGVVFVPAADATGAVGSLTFTVRDDGGFANGGQAADTTPNMLTFNMTAVNDAPVNAVPGGQVVDEDASLAFSAANGNALSVTDVDAATLTVTLVVDHGTLTLASIAGLGFTDGDGTADSTMTFSGTAAAINVALGAGLSYDPDADFSGSDAISIVTTDGGEAGTGPVGTDGDSIAIGIAAINDAPAGADAAFTINEDGTFTFAESHFGFTDPVEGNDFLGVVIATMPGAGTLLYEDAAVSAGRFVSLHDIALGKLIFVPAADANGAPYGSFTFEVRDDGGALNGGQDTDQSANTITFNVVAVNDAPANSVPAGQAMNEDGSLTLSAANGNAIGVADVDATTLTVTLSVVDGTLTLASTAGLSFDAGDGSGDSTMTFSGTAAAINAALSSGLTYNPGVNFSGSDAISIVTTDGGEAGTGTVGTDGDSVAIAIAAINDAPAGTSATITLDEDRVRTLTEADFGFSDPVEGDGFAGVVIATLPANGTLRLNGAALLAAATFVTAAQLAAGQLVFEPDANENGAAYASFDFQVRDTGGADNGGEDIDQAPDTITFDVNPVNDAPVLDLDAGAAGSNAALIYTENDAATRIAPAATLTDDSADFASGTIIARFAANGAAADRLSILSGDGIAVSPADDTLFYGGVPIGFWSGGVAGADLVVQLNADATAAAVEAVLRSIAYANLSDDPEVPARTIAVEVADGDGATTSAQAIVNLLAVDDAAVARNDSFTLDEAGALAGSLFADHGAGADGDVDGPALVVAAVNGASAYVGQQILLASGALLTLNADGSFAYAANHAFDATPTAASGASNTLAFDSFTYTLAGGGTATVTLTVTGLDSDDILRGTAGNDILVAGIGDDALDGGAGNDTLYGEGGADIARGGIGDDVYIVDSMADVTEEAAGEGNDTIITTLSYILSSNQEIETLSTQTHAGTEDVFLTGNQYNNTLIGNAGDNIINGVDGADVMYGLAGDDTYAIDNPGDLVIDGVDQGNDLVFTYLSHTLSNGNQIETLSTVFHQGTDAINLGGNDYSNTLIGNYGANYLNGNGGVDVMIGLNGNDTYVADNAGDQVQEVAGGGSDLLYSFVSYALAAGQEVETISTAVQGGTGALNLTGNGHGQTVIGNYGANLLNGGGGNDVLYGLDGADTFAFTTALGAGNVDTIGDFAAGSDKIGLDDAIFTAIGASLNAGAFVIGTAAGDADDRIIYNSTTGALFYDADGNGAGAAVQFATLSGAPVLAASDFIMI